MLSDARHRKRNIDRGRLAHQNIDARTLDRLESSRGNDQVVAAGRELRKLEFARPLAVLSALRSWR